jgi:alpha-D-ribose 1-methylphosphonate 5-triphosphate diphosphatase
MDLAQAWALISGNPARATGLTDRGTIEAGKRADLVIVDPVAKRAVATLVQGRIAFLSAGASGRISG